LSATAGPALAAVTPDPIFGLIDLHRKTWEAYTDAHEVFLEHANNHHPHPERGIVLGEAEAWKFEDVLQRGADFDGSSIGSIAVDLLPHCTDEVHLRRVKTGEMAPCHRR
jgi:hypothetical protein